MLKMNILDFRAVVSITPVGSKADSEAEDFGDGDKSKL
jgi:hypothetical protein